jgi:hypothetical protein
LLEREREREREIIIVNLKKKKERFFLKGTGVLLGLLDGLLVLLEFRHSVLVVRFAEESTSPTHFTGKTNRKILPDH